MSKPVYTTLQQIVDQLEHCGYVTECDCQVLEQNVAFIALKERAAAEEKVQSSLQNFVEIETLKQMSIQEINEVFNHLNDRINVLKRMVQVLRSGLGGLVGYTDEKEELEKMREMLITLLGATNADGDTGKRTIAAIDALIMTNTEWENAGL